MKESHGEGVATDTDPRRRIDYRESGKNATPGDHAGEVSSRENAQTTESRRCWNKRKATLALSLARDKASLRAVVDPEHAWKCLTRSLGEPMSVLSREAWRGPWRGPMRERRR